MRLRASGRFDRLAAWPHHPTKCTYRQGILARASRNTDPQAGGARIQCGRSAAGRTPGGDVSRSLTRGEPNRGRSHGGPAASQTCRCRPEGHRSSVAPHRVRPCRSGGSCQVSSAVAAVVASTPSCVDLQICCSACSAACSRRYASARAARQSSSLTGQL